MSAPSEEETALLREAFEAYRLTFVNGGSALALAPYEHVDLPHIEGIQALTYLPMVASHLQHLANELNAFVYHFEQIVAWAAVLPRYDLGSQLVLLREFVACPATVLITYPYSLRSRFIFSVSHLSHQANLLTREKATEADLPADNAINYKVMVRASGHWNGFAAFDTALRDLDDADYKKTTRDFRHKYQHRIPSNIQVGHTETVVRMRHANGARYGIGGSGPLVLTALLSELTRQHEVAIRVFDAYSGLIREQLNASTSALKQRALVMATTD